jgi:hypothetical protein
MGRNRKKGLKARPINAECTYSRRRLEACRTKARSHLAKRQFRELRERPPERRPSVGAVGQEQSRLVATPLQFFRVILRSARP